MGVMGAPRSLPAVVKTRASDQGEVLTMASLEKHMKVQKRKSSDDEPLMSESEVSAHGIATPHPSSLRMFPDTLIEF